MGAVRGCNLPDDLMYNVESNVWARREADGNVTVGLTAYACSLASEIVSYTPKKDWQGYREGQILRHRGIRQVGGTGEDTGGRRSGGGE